MRIRSSHLRALVPLCFTLAVTSAARAARAETCESASEQGQSLRNDHKLAEARERFVICSRSVCEKDVRADCAQWLAEVDAQLRPSIVLAVTDEQGVDVKGVRVAVDGKVVDLPPAGAPLVLEPGEHTLLVGAEGYNAERRAFVARAGERATRMPIVLGSASAQEGEGARGGKPVPVASIVSFSAAGVGLVVGTVFAILAGNAKSDPGCPVVTNCPSTFDVASHNATVSTDSIVAGVGFGVGLVGAGLGAWFLFNNGAPASGPAQPAPSAALRVVPRIGPGWAGIGGTF